MNYHVLQGWWKDTGTPEDILESNRLVFDELQTKLDGTLEKGGSVQGPISLGENSGIGNGATVRGPSIIGKDTVFEPGVYFAPYSSIGDNVVMKRGEIEDSIVMDYCRIDVPHRITSRIIGKHSTMISADHTSPKGFKLTIGENCQLIL